MQHVTEEEKEEGVVVVVEEGEGGQVVGKDVDAGESMAILTPLILWRKNTDVEKMVEAQYEGGKFVVVDVGMGMDEDVGMGEGVGMGEDVGMGEVVGSREDIVKLD